MRIGIDVRTLSYEYTGIPIYTHDIIRYWNEWNRDDEFFLYSNRDFELDFKLNCNFHVVIDKHQFGGLWVQTRLVQLLKKDRIDVFWEPMNFLPHRIPGVRYLVTIHDLAVFLHPEYGSVTDAILERTFLKKSCKRADRIIAISESTREDIVRHLDVDRSKVKVIYNGDSPYTEKEPSYTWEEKKTILKKWNLEGEDFLLYVGTIEPRKNIPTIVNAFDLLKNCGKFNGKLLLVGKSGWKSRRIYQQIAESKHTEDIICTGYVADIEKECFYRNACCFVFPSLYEGFGFPVLEAMSVGLPIVASRVSSIPEVGGDSVVYLNEENIKNASALANCISQLLTFNAEKIEKIQIKEKELARTFSRRKCAAMLWDEL